MRPVILQPGPRHWLDTSIFAPFEVHLLRRLEGGRYSNYTVRLYLASIAHFAHWTTQKRLSIESINESSRDRFLTEHLPRCHCPYPVRKQRHEAHAAIGHLLIVLREKGAISSADDRTPLSREITAFDVYMRDVGGLAVTTRQQRRALLGRFLTTQFGSHEIRVEEIDANLLRRFVLGVGCRRWGAGSTRVAGNTIGCYLKYRRMLGNNVAHLVDAIPTVRQWRLTGLPDVLSDEQIDMLLASFDKGLPSYRRAYAMVRCVTDLGLRCAEVVSLRIDDIDWSRGVIRITRTKTHFDNTLPLPTATGEAIADYLQYERPATGNRAVFVRHTAPYDVPIKTGVARRAVIAAFARCGLVRTDPHVLRHSVASRLLRGGTPMKHIADILRHRSLDTSRIYTKIDLDRLAAVALPWSGRAK
jgi:integrase/recombinase XerD